MRGTPLRTYLCLLVAATLLPITAFAGYLTWAASRQEEGAVRRGMQETARALSLTVDREVQTAVASLEALATSSALERGDYDGFRGEILKFLGNRDGWISVVDEDGQQHLDTQLRPGDPLPRTDDHQWLRNVFGANRIFISGAVTGPAVRQPFVAISLKVPRPGKAVVLTLTITPETLSKVLLEQQLPAGWYGVIADRESIIIGRTQSPELAGRPMTVKLAPPQGTMRAVTREGDDVYITWNTSQLSGWHTGVAAPAGAIDGISRAAISRIGILGALSLSIGVVAAVLLARRFTRPLAALATAVTAAPTNDNQLRSARSDIREIEQLATAFRTKLDEVASSIAARDRAQSDLEMLNRELETRVRERTGELTLMSEQLNEARKMEAIGRLTAGIAHDFNNLLTAIQGNLELLGKRLSDQRLKRYCDNARAASERAAQVTAELLASARQQKLVPKPVDVNASVRNMSELLRGTFAGSIRIETILHSGLWPAMADSTQLELVILDIAINARDAMPLGGVLTIETSNASVGETQGRPEDPAPGEYVSVAIADTGTGMTDEVRARAFEAFFTTKGIGKGSGLGLAQALGIAKQLGGGIRIQTKCGEGTRVEVLFPRAREGQPELPPATDAQSMARVSGTSVLLGDDDPDGREVRPRSDER